MAVLTTLGPNTEPFTFLGRYLHKVAQEALYPQLRLYRLGVKVPLPANRGKQINIPYFTKTEPVEAMGSTSGTEVQIPQTEYAVQGSSYSGTIQGYHGYFSFSDFFWATHEVPSVLAAGVRQLAAHMAKTYDNRILGTICGSGTFISPGGLNATPVTGSVLSTNAMTLKCIMGADTQLESTDVPGFEGDAMYTAILHPRQVYDIFTNAANLSVSGQLQMGLWLNTREGQRKYENMEIGVVGNTRILTSTASVKLVAGALGMSAGHTGWNALFIAPGAYAVVDLESARPSIIIQPFGSAGTADPTKKKMTVGIKAYFAVVAMDVANRMCRSVSGANTA